VSVQFGKCNFDSRPIDRGWLEKVAVMLDPFGPDGKSTYIKDGFGILYFPFHTTKESRHEIQPLVFESGEVLSWDGRLDNREELISLLRGRVSIVPSDSEIVAASYARWGTDCFAKFIGDWALSIGNPQERSVTLAKDFLGTRHLYYSFDREQICWSTVLDPLVLLAGKSLALNEEYVAGWLGMFPAAHLTPYQEVHSVPPSCFVRLKEGKSSVTKYWDFNPERRILDRSDEEYEEHFRMVFRESVRRRLRADAPLLAELSGGMDSSSIVCMADRILGPENGKAAWLDTVSFYSSSEPTWNESPYFAAVESQRGREGCHIAINPDERVVPESDTPRFLPSPSAVNPSDATRRLADYIKTRGHRVVLSGVGGDEVTGGVPTPKPELQDLIARAQFSTLVHQLKAWALNKRRPWFHLLFESISDFLPSGSFSKSEHLAPASWVDPQFARRRAFALGGYESRLRLVGPLPSFQQNLITLEALKRQLGVTVLDSEPLLEKRFPFLDRDLLEFLYAIPRQQLVRPGYRRSLLRRALTGIVPGIILERRRKAFVSRGPLIGLSYVPPLEASKQLRFVDAGKFSEVLLDARRGVEVPTVTIIRTLRLEYWLNHIQARGIPGSSELLSRYAPENRKCA
jgi:asparagine synthase (glutamine-hydrolysing)